MGVRDLETSAIVRRGPVVRTRVEWSDIDTMGVVFFEKYLRFMEAAESALFRSVGWPYERVERDGGVWIARVRLTVDYRLPARMDDEVDTCAEIVKLGGASIHVRFPMDRADGVRVADGSLVLACLDRITMQTSRLPHELRASLMDATLT